MIWIPITVFAAFAQNLRFMLQKYLKATRLSTAGASFARFLYSAPILALGASAYTGGNWPGVAPGFWGYAMVGGLAQIGGTVCVVALFAQRNFAVGITFKKTEVMLTILTGLLVLGEGISVAGLAAMCIGFVGVLILSDPPQGGAGWGRVVNKAAGFGLASGAFFAVSAVGYRGATLAVNSDDFFMRALVTLAFVTAFQTAVMAVWLALRERGEIARVIASRRVSGLVGITSLLGSLGWFSALTLQTAAYVKALGQVELVFTFLASHFVFKEVSSRREVVGILLIVISIFAIILAL
jgi:drug/metabolite transporter (DMT)-like permease